jgi:hypothetical protein
MAFPHYDMPLYRPPSEGQNLIIQATLGCSSNHCTFCSMYKTKSYMARPLDLVFADIDAAYEEWPTAHRVFLADGDALTLPMDTLIAILDKLGATFPNLTRVSAYATPKNLIDKSVEELQALKERKLSLAYMGIESGSTRILKKIIKGASQRTHGMALSRAREAGLKVSATVILGLGGRKDWRDHIEGTAALINSAPPNFLSTLQLGLADDVVDEFMDGQDPDFEMQDDGGILAEQDYLLSLLSPPKPVIFRSNHASNCLPLAGNLPKDTDRLRADVAAAMEDQGKLRPLVQRRL